jgi:hypothetical protein
MPSFGLKKMRVNERRGSGKQEWSWALFEALRLPERPNVYEHNSKCMKAKGEGPHGSLRGTRARHALEADAGRTRHQAKPPQKNQKNKLYLLKTSEPTALRGPAAEATSTTDHVLQPVSTQGKPRSALIRRPKVVLHNRAAWRIRRGSSQTALKTRRKRTAVAWLPSEAQKRRLPSRRGMQGKAGRPQSFYRRPPRAGT